MSSQVISQIIRSLQKLRRIRDAMRIEKAEGDRIKRVICVNLEISHLIIYKDGDRSKLISSYFVFFL